MIPRDYITAWRAQVPWVQDFQVEQDLIISRALVEIFSHPVLTEGISFRGGTGADWRLRVRGIIECDQITTKDSSRAPLAAAKGTDLSSGTSRAPCATASASR